ncbi:hypothetical protein FKW77_000998 [Venturia effusa]|uniref:Uncharacterized protein n=1 Tax=Venturia effusa TaxID=50376 RepID=A0A517L4U5_9PEZI|nr:hypothetical protein FKW77_000998 [Venturia effusa]
MASFLLKRNQELQKQVREKDDLISELQARQADHDYVMQRQMELEKHVVDAQELSDSALSAAKGMKVSADELNQLSRVNLPEYAQLLKTRDETAATSSAQEEEITRLTDILKTLRLGEHDERASELEKLLEDAKKSEEILTMENQKLRTENDQLQGEKADWVKEKDQLQQEKARWVKEKKRLQEQVARSNAMGKSRLPLANQGVSEPTRLSQTMGTSGMSLANEDGSETAPFGDGLSGDEVEAAEADGRAGEALSDGAAFGNFGSSSHTVGGSRAPKRSTLTAFSQYSEPDEARARTAGGGYVSKNKDALWGTWNNTIACDELSEEVVERVKTALSLTSNNNSEKLLYTTMRKTETCLHVAKKKGRSAWLENDYQNAACHLCSSKGWPCVIKSEEPYDEETDSAGENPAIAARTVWRLLPLAEKIRKTEDPSNYGYWMLSSVDENVSSTVTNMAAVSKAGLGWMKEGQTPSEAAASRKSSRFRPALATGTVGKQAATKSKK